MFESTPIYDRLLTRYTFAHIWEEAYKLGAEDERKAIEWDVPEYAHAARSNPYRRYSA